MERTSRVKLKIPAGIDEGARLRSSGGGEAGLRNGSPGDLYVVIHIKTTNLSARWNGPRLRNADPFSVAALGGEVRVPTLAGAVSLKIPAGTQSDSVFRVRAQGMPSLQGSSRGDILARVQVEVPTHLNSDQRKALEHFAQLCGEDNTPLHKSFTDRLRELFS